MKDKRVLITGGAGFIGANLAQALSTGNIVTVVDDLSFGSLSNIPENITFHRRCVLEDSLPLENIDTVYHLAALSSYPMHVDEPNRGVRVNVEGFVNVLEQARQAGCDQVVYASTSSLYGSRVEPTRESDATHVTSAYEASKHAREGYAQYFSNAYGMQVAGLRLFSVYEGFGGKEAHKAGCANVIAQFAHAIAQGTQPILYGDGSQSRDFVHVQDVVSAFTVAAEDKLGGLYNVGTGRRHSFTKIIDLINEAMGTEITPKFIPNPILKSAYVYDTCADISKLQEATGWKPEIDINTGIERVCEYYQKDPQVSLIR